MAECAILEDDLIEKFILGSGSGGQKVNKTHSCVYLKHVPSGIEVKCQRTRSRELNRLYARRELLERIKEKVYQIESKKQKEAEKIRRQKKKRSRRAKEKMLEEKHHRAKIKEGRKSPNLDDIS